MSKIKSRIILDGYELKNRKKPVNFEEMTGRHWIVPDYYEHGPVKLLELTGAYVSPFGVVYHNNRVVRESVSEYDQKNFLLPTYLKKRLKGKVKKVAGTAVVFFNPFYGNFYHFTIECLCRLFCLHHLRHEVAVLIHADSPSFVTEYIRLLGFDEIVAIQADELAYCERVLLVGQTAGAHKQHPELIRALAGELARSAGGSKEAFKDHKHLYISRKKAVYRSIENEGELLDFLKDYGFKMVNFEDISLAERIPMMQNVEVLMGVHGAGLTNMMFMEPGKIVFHLIHEGHHEDSFYNLAAAFDHDSVFIQGKSSVNDPRGVCYDNFSVDIANVEKYLKQHLLARSSQAG